MTERKARPARLAFLLVAAAIGSTASADDSRWQVARADVRVTCPLTVGGSFEARSGAVTGTLALAALDPATLNGDLSLELGTLDTGISLRNDHLRHEYLEVGKGDGFDRAVLSDIKLRGVTSAAFEGRTEFTGTLRLHGTTREVSGPAEVRREGASLRIEASFPVTLADYGIPKPQYLGVGVKSQVQVKVSLAVAAVASEASR